MDDTGGGTVSRALAYVLGIGGAIGFLASFVLAVEKMALLRDPGYAPTCSLNPILSCGSVMSTPQAAAFGFANPLLGIAGFAVVTTVGVVVLSGARFPRWFWYCLLAGTVFGVGFVHWLIAQSLYNIQALCPYCMVVWAVTIPIFWYTALHVLRQERLVPAAARRLVEKAAKYHTVFLALWYMAIIVLVAHAFWLYWSTLL